jgi:excisionase family DNA binding protein
MEQLLTIQQVVGYLSVSSRTVRRLVSTGRIPHVRIGRVVRIVQADVSRWLAARKE